MIKQLLITALVFFVQANNVMANDNALSPQDRAQKAIDACWEISIEDRNSINTNR